MATLAMRSAIALSQSNARYSTALRGSAESEPRESMLGTLLIAGPSPRPSPIRVGSDPGAAWLLVSATPSPALSDVRIGSTRSYMLRVARGALSLTLNIDASSRSTQYQCQAGQHQNEHADDQQGTALHLLRVSSVTVYVTFIKGRFEMIECIPDHGTSRAARLANAAIFSIGPRGWRRARRACAALFSELSEWCYTIGARSRSLDTRMQIAPLVYAPSGSRHSKLPSASIPCPVTDSFQRHRLSSTSLRD